VSDAARLRAIIMGDAARWRLLGLVRALNLPDCWIGAGFVRNAVWDRLHGRAVSPLASDVDVVWFDADRAGPSVDGAHEAALAEADPRVAWSVKNQARMHVRNGDAPYASTADAMARWPETATAVAVRRTGADACEVIAPHGLADLFAMVLRATPAFGGEKRYLGRGCGS
jgi:hypothetical protein